MTRPVIVALIAILLAGCGDQPAAARRKPADARAIAPAVKPPVGEVAAPPRVEEVPSPSGPGAGEPFVSAAGESLLLSWLEPVPGTDRVALRFSRWKGEAWSEPRTIVERRDLFVNWADFPSLVEDAGGILFAHWLQRSGRGTYAYDVRMAVSRDGGANWGPSFLLNRDGNESEHGFVSLAPLPAGGVGAAWLDGRKMKGEGHHAGGDMTLRYAVVDADGRLASDQELDGRTCECCTTGMAMAADGPVVVYRDRSASEIRDISYVRPDEGSWTVPQAVREDGWKIEGCPVNGPQIDAAGRRVAAAWFTAAEKPRVYLSFSDDGGSTFRPAVAVDDGRPGGRVDVVLLEDSSAVVSWLEQTAAGAEIRARSVNHDGRTSASFKIADSSLARGAGFTRTARLATEVWFAWTDQGEKARRVRVARVRLR